MDKDFSDIYNELDDDKLLRLAKYEYDELIPEAQNALNIELKKRNLSIKVNKYKEIEKIKFTDEEINRIANEYRNCSCPICGRKIGGINLFEMTEFCFAIFIIFWKKRKYFGCKECLIDQIKQFQKRMLLFSFIIPIQTIISLFYYLDCNKLIKRIEEENNPTKEYYKYVKDNIYDIKIIVDED